jgi:hypothetical protein
MTEKTKEDVDFIREKYVNFVYDNMKILVTDKGMSEREALEVVVDTTFVSIHNLWVQTYGPRYMAEEFYRIADNLVAKTMDGEETE